MDLLVDMPVREAAARLGVTPHRVRALIAAGDLHAVKDGREHRLSRLDVERLDGRLVPGRRWSLGHAWARLTDPIPPNVPLHEMAARFAGRGVRHLLDGHPSMLERLAQDDRLLLSGHAVRGSDLGGPQVEGYVLQEELESVVEEYGLAPAQRAANVVLRAVADDVELPPRAPALLVAVDLLDSLLPRARALGAEMIEARR